MNCAGNCNQGRACTCSEPAKPSRVMKAAIAITIMLIIAEFAMLLDMNYPQAGRWAATILAGVFSCLAAGWLIYWIAERVIDAIEFMTRWED